MWTLEKKLPARGVKFYFITKQDLPEKERSWWQEAVSRSSPLSKWFRRAQFEYSGHPALITDWQGWNLIKIFCPDPSSIVAFAEERLITQPEEADVVHDLLAFMAKEMIRLNEEKQFRIKHFLTWLEKDILKGSIEDQKNKTKIRNFHEGTLEELMDTLKKNKVIPDPCPSSI